MKSKYLILFMAIIVMAFALSGCFLLPKPTLVPPQLVTPPPTSTFPVYITDKPVSISQVQHLYVDISNISVHVANSSTSTWYTSPAGTYDLTTLVGTSLEIANFSLQST